MQSCLLTACHTRVTSSSAYISLCKYEIDNFEAKLLLLFYGNLQIEFSRKSRRSFQKVTHQSNQAVMKYLSMKKTVVRFTDTDFCLHIMISIQ